MKLFLSAVLFSALAYSQSFQGTLRGRVFDPAGSAVAAAKVTITDEATKVNRTTVSNDLGEYVFSAVRPATYTLEAEGSGFKKLERKGVEVATQAAVVVDLALELGQVSESVSVVAEVALLQTADASTGQVIDTQKITDLPILGRNTFFTTKLAQSVVFVGNPKFARMQDQNGNSQVSIAGGPLKTNNYLIDGISIADSLSRAVILPSPEAVQEVKLQASTYDAEVGRTGGGTINTLLRSGTNNLHGSAVGYFRETDWLANNFFANKAGQPIADQPFRNWAASLGGPIFIPKVYDGRNRTFFFISTEAYRQKDAASITLSVPTALERKGDFSQSFTRTGALQTIYDPLSTNLTTGTRTPFGGNVIPAGQLSASGLALASYYPLPNLPTAYFGAPNYNVTVNNPNRGDQSIWKADHEFASWIRASGSYIHQKTYETSSQWFPNVATPGQGLLYRSIDATQANATITPQPTTVVAVRWGFNRFYSRSAQASAGFDLNSVGLGSLAGITPNTAFPSLTIGGAVNGCGAGTSSEFAAYGGGCANQDVYYSRSFNTTVSKFLGRHSLKAGFDYRTIHDTGTPSTGPTSLGFTDVFTRAQAQSPTTATGSALASLLLGYPTGGQMTLTTNFNDFVRYWGFFIHDDFRVTPKLTLNFGVRLEQESGIQEDENKLVTVFDPAAPSPLQKTVPYPLIYGVVGYAGVNGNPTQSGNARSLKPGPRFGFAYSANDKTVFRGGYGIYWAPGNFALQNTLGYSQNTAIIASTNNNFTPAVSLSNPYPNGLLQPTGNSLGALSGIGQPITVLDPNAKSGGYVQQYSFEAQRQVPAGFVLSAGFLGSHTLHFIVSGRNIDQLDPAYFPLGSALNQSVPNPLYNNGGTGTVGTPTVSRSQLLLPFPQYTSVTLANSDVSSARYYSFYFRAQRRFANGLNLLASYTFSRSVDNIFGSFNAGVNQLSPAAGPQNAYNINGEWGLSTQDVPNRFTSAITYELPFGKGKTFLRNSRALDYVVGGWSLNVVSAIQNGYPLIVTQTNNNSAIGASYQRPNATGISPETSGSTTQRLNSWLNPAAFSQAAQFTFGNVSRTISARGPGLFNWDVSIFKTFSIREGIKAQIRAEALNATNTPQFGTPNTNINSSAFGTITTQVNNPRLIQLGARVTF
jgi:trimeric autotransporter adhesin